MKKILLTGGTGFIGRNIKASLLSQKYEISAPERNQLDLTDERNVDDFFKNKEFDIVLHCAAKPGHRNANDPTNLYTTNIMMFENLLKHKDSYGKFINFGSGAIYDQSKNISFVSEAQMPTSKPKDEYGAYKFTESLFIEKTDNFLNLNLFGVFGKYEDWEIRFISNAICKSLFNLPITLRQNRRFSYLYIDDLMPILEFFIENNTEQKNYNIVPSTNTELLKIAKIIQNLSPGKTDINVCKEGYGSDYTGDNTRLCKEYKDINFTAMEIAIEKLYRYYQQNIDSINMDLLKYDK